MSAIRILVAHAVRERLSSMNRVTLSAATLVIPLLPLLESSSAGQTPLPGQWTAVLFALIFGSGLIGPDLASGVMQLVLARPVMRAQVVTARWLAAAGLATAALAFQFAVVATVRLARGVPPAGSEVWASVVPALSVALALPAVLACLSAFIAGLGDVRAWVLCLVAGELVKWIGMLRNSPWLVRAGTEWGGVMLPVVDAGALAGSWLPVVAWLSTLTLALAVGIVVFNRKELSYGSA